MDDLPSFLAAGRCSLEESLDGRGGRPYPFGSVPPDAGSGEALQFDSSKERAVIAVERLHRPVARFKLVHSSAFVVQACAL